MVHLSTKLRMIDGPSIGAIAVGFVAVVAQSYIHVLLKLDLRERRKHLLEQVRYTIARNFAEQKPVQTYH